MRYHPRIYVVHVSPHFWTVPIKQIMFSGPRGPLVLPLVGPSATIFSPYPPPPFPPSPPPPPFPISHLKICSF